ncbi:MmgE/PrpD family protein [Rhodococcus sp. NPDC056960]|uniref:MmgE/PrpD family protein n=1 Tax=Rhodococcus sp. NPDC056960 TaxID=3345982 RepID=UPI003644BC1F
MADSTIAERLGVFASTLEIDALPRPVVDRVTGCLIHALTVGMAGSTAGFGRRAEQAGPGVSSPSNLGGYARSLVTGQWHPASTAAFINGVHLHARAQEDTHGTFHPGVSVLPAALAAAETSAVDGRTFLAAVVAGYEVGIALSRPLTDLTTPPFRATAVFGPVAAAAAVGRIRGLSGENMASALAIAASISGGTSESFGAGTDEWHFQSGIAAMGGLMATQLAEAGVTGSRTAFEAEAGYLDCFSRSHEAAETIGRDIGRSWNLLDVTFKPYPVCAFNQTPAMLAVRLRESGLRADEVASIRLRMNEREATYPGMPSRGPFTSTAQTLMSARFAFATGIVHGDITYDHLQQFTDPQILDLIGKIDLVAEPGRSPKTARSTVVLVDGTTVHDAIENSDAMLSWDIDGVVHNAERLASEIPLSTEELETLVESVATLPQASSVDPLIRATLAGISIGA